jgi:uncharacterized protein (TIGR02147 family)
MTTLLEYESLSELLNSEFFKRKHRNDSYSLRAFARDLALSPSSLSEILRGRKNVNEKTAETIAEKLKLKIKEKAYLKDLVLAESARNEKVREHAIGRLATARKTKRYKPLQEDQFKVISDWHHSAILELIQVKDFDPSPKWIAQRLGVHVEDVTSALTRLEKLKMIKKSKGTYKASEPDAYDAIIERPSPAIRKFQRQVISMSLDSLFEDQGNEREILSMILAIPRAQLPEFRVEMRKFVSDFWQKIESVPKDELYSFSMQLCPVKNRARRW